jgi:hypothetical protein
LVVVSCDSCFGIPLQIFGNLENTNISIMSVAINSNPPLASVPQHIRVDDGLKLAKRIKDSLKI